VKPTVTTNYIVTAQNSHNCAASNSTSVTVNPDALTWTGLAAGDGNNWNNASNWNDDVTDSPPVNPPTTCADVVIPFLGTGNTNYPTLTSAASCKSLLIESSATGTGSLIGSEYLTISLGTATVQRYIGAATWTNASDGWHLISSPVASQAISGAWTPTGTGNDYDFYAFDETEMSLYEYWVNQKSNPSLFTNFTIGKGYLVAYQQEATKEFTGQLNTAAQTPLFLTFTAGSPYQGWNLVGNPFTSAIGWTTGSWTKTNIDGVAQVWDESAQSYKTTSDVSINNVIPAMSGFMVHASAASPVLTIPLNARIHSTTNWYKSGEEDYILLLANDPEGGSSQSSIVRFNEAATNGYDTEFDSYFMSGFAPLFYSVAGENAYALNTLPAKTNDLAIPFGFIKNNSSGFNIELAKNIPGTVVYLEDKKAGYIHNLNDNPVYNFSSEEGDDINRFVLRFGTVGISESDLAKPVYIYSVGKDVYISANQLNNGKSDVFIYDALGRLVYQGVYIPAAGNAKYTTLTNPGAYIVKVISHTGTVTSKVIIH